ncbi:ArsR family transcriptional regulator [Opitutae bacterium]|nr:ArsR family transcriptional regulator [Opitutae bacterium]
MKDKKNQWNVLSNHGLVLICLHNYEGYPMRLIAKVIGITERAVQRIISDLEQFEYITREKVGRKNKYKIRKEASLRHAVSGHCTVGQFLECFDANIDAVDEINNVNHWRIGEHGSEMYHQIKES